MWFAIISSVICFAVATILFTPQLRNYPFYQVLSFYFLFEGGWTILNAIVAEIWPYSTFMQWVHYVGAIAFGALLFYRLFAYYWKQKHGGVPADIQAPGGKGEESPQNTDSGEQK